MKEDCEHRRMCAYWKDLYLDMVREKDNKESREETYLFIIFALLTLIFIYCAFILI